MDDSNPLVSFGYHAQINYPNVSQTSSYEQAGHARWVGNMTFVQMEAPTLLVGEEGFNAKASTIPVTGFFSQGHIGDQVNRFLRVFTPPSHNQNRAMGVLSDIDIRQGEAITWLQENLIQGKLVPFIVNQTILGGTANIFPTAAGDFRLQLVAVKLPIPQENDITPFRQQGLEGLNQLAMCFFGKMTFASLHNHPDQWQGSLLVNDANHQSQTIPSHFTTVHSQHQWSAPGQPRQQCFHKGQKVSFRINSFVLQTATKSLDAAFYFAVVWCFLGHCFQLTFSTADDPADHAG